MHLHPNNLVQVIPRIIILSPQKNNQCAYMNEIFEKPKSISFNNFQYNQISNLKRQHHIQKQNKQQIIRNQHRDQFCKEQNLISQSIFQNQLRKKNKNHNLITNRSNLYLKQVQLNRKSISDHQSQTNRVIVKDRNRNYYQSLRATITNQPSRVYDKSVPLSPASKKNYQKQNLFTISEIINKNVRIKEEQQKKGSANSYQKLPFFKAFEIQLKNSKDNLNFGLQSNEKALGNRFNIFRQGENQLKKIADKNKSIDESIIAKIQKESSKIRDKCTKQQKDGKQKRQKRERKCPSFISSRGQNKKLVQNLTNQSEELTQQRRNKVQQQFKVEKKDNQNEVKFGEQCKRMYSSKHAKSFSVFENFHRIKSNFPSKCKKAQEGKDQFLIKEQAANCNKINQKTQNIKKANNWYQHKDLTQTCHTTFSKCNDKQNVFNTAHQQEKSKLSLFFLRQSLKNQVLKDNTQKIKQNKIQTSNFIKKDKYCQVQTKFQDKFLKKETGIQSKQQNSKYLKNPHDSQKEQIQQNRNKSLLVNQNYLSTQESSAQNKKSAIQDIKQVLINCNLFSQEDYQKVFQNHEKDLLHSHAQKKSNTVRFKSHKEQQKTSLKDLIDSSQSSQDQSRLSSQQQKRFAQLASICQHKRSKWILQQTDTIKQSLKQLSQFATEKSLKDNQWKKISVKDFSSPRKIRKSQKQLCQIDKINQEYLFQSVVEEIQNYKCYKSDQKIKIQSKEFKESKVNFKVFQQKNERMHFNQKQNQQIKISDFQIRWFDQQRIVYPSNSQQKSKSFVSFWGRHKKTGFICTIKKYEKTIIQSLGKCYIENFIKKIKIQMILLNHSNIQKIYGVFGDQENIYVICQFYQAKMSNVLEEILKQSILNSSQHSITLCNSMNCEKNRIILFREIINGLQEIHLNYIIHKSFQPFNIGIIFNTCKISGFDNADFITSQKKQNYNEYCSPQTLFDSIKSAMDIWSLGIIGYQLLIGEKPFSKQKNKNQNNQTMRRILECNIKIPQQKVDLCQQMLKATLRRDPKQRFSIFGVKSKWELKVKQYAPQNKNYYIKDFEQLIKTNDKQ